MDAEVWTHKLDRVIELLEQLVGNELTTNHSQVNEIVASQQLQPISINLDKYTKHDMKRKRTRILNKSKFLDSTQRESLFGFIDQFKESDAIDELRKQTKHKRPSIFQKIVQEKLDIKLSYYMSNKLVNLMLNHSTPEQQTTDQLTNEQLTNDSPRGSFRQKLKGFHPNTESDYESDDL